MENNTRQQDTFVGLVYITLPICFYIPYLLSLRVMGWSAEICQMPCYRLMFHLGLADLIQLSAHPFAGVMTLCQCEIGWFNKFIGGFANAAWMTMTSLHAVIAFNRCCQFCFKDYIVEVIFSKQKTTIWIILCWIWGFGFFCSFMTPWVAVKYFPQGYGFGYDGSLKYSKQVMSFEFWANNVTLLALSFCFYVAMLVQVKMTHATMGQNAENRKREMRLGFQVMLIWSWLCLASVIWHWYHIILPDNKWTFFLLNIIWIINCGINTVVYLTFNKTIKRNIRQLFLSQAVVVPTGTQRGKSNERTKSKRNTAV